MIVVRPAEPGSASVTFHLPAVSAASVVAVVGDFNNWDPEEHLMSRSDAGYAITITVSVGRRYRFRYLLDRTEWQNDWQADDYVPNRYGGDDSVLDLTANGPHRRDINGSSSPS
jgi:1,4-alpha-glucan branching enzyme